MHDDLPSFNDDLLSYSISQGPGYAVVSVAGEIDASTEGKFRDVLTSVQARGVLRIVVDLAGVTFMGSRGIAVLIGARRLLAAEGGSLALAAPRGKIAEILSLTEVDEVIPVASSVADAVARWNF
jgi:anti-sigma B factor antagonist